MFKFFNKVPSMDIKNMGDIKNKHRIIDIRTKREIDRFGKVKGVQNIEMDMLLADPNKYIDKNKEYYLFCQSGIKSKKTVKKLNKLGFDVINLRGGHYIYTRR